METSRSHYDALGVDEDADTEVIRDAFHSLVKQLHPDARAHLTEPQITEVDRELDEVTEAWKVLGNPRSRRGYDLKLARERERAAAAVQHRTEPPDPRILLHEAQVSHLVVDGSPGDTATRVAEAGDPAASTHTPAPLIPIAVAVAVLLIAAAILFGTLYAG